MIIILRYNNFSLLIIFCIFFSSGAAAVRAASRLADEASTSQHTQPIRTVKTEQPRTPVSHLIGDVLKTGLLLVLHVVGVSFSVA